MLKVFWILRITNPKQYKLLISDVPKIRSSQYKISVGAKIQKALQKNLGHLLAALKQSQNLPTYQTRPYSPLFLYKEHCMVHKWDLISYNRYFFCRLQEEDVLTKYLDSNHFHQRRPQTLAEVFWNRKKWAPWKNVHLQIGHRGQAVFTCDCLFHYLMLNCQGGISVWMYLYLVFSIIVLVFHFCIRYFVFDADLSWRDFRLAVAGVERGEGFDCWLKMKRFLRKIDWFLSLNQVL